MTKEELVTKLADVLDISESTKDFAFKIFTHRIVELLNETQAIIIPNLGAFQLRKEPLLREERFKIKGVEKNTKEVLIYSPNTDYTQIKSDSLFLILNLSDNVENNLKFDENIFSLGVNQPTIPLPETQEIDNEKDKVLKKSITEKINELLSNSEIRNDFDLWLEFTGLSRQQDHEGSITENEPGSKKADEIDNLMNTEEFIEEELSEEIGGNQKEEDLNAEAKRNIPEMPEVKENMTKEEKSSEAEPLETGPSEPEPTEHKTEEESTEWDWGDELKAEFKENQNEPETDNIEQTGSDEEQNNEIDFDEEEAENEINFNEEKAEIDENIESSLSGENQKDENTDEKKDEETKQEPTSVHHTVLFSPENTNTQEIMKNTPSSSSDRRKKKLSKYGKTFWILFAAFILVAIIGIYFLFIPSKNIKNLKSTVVDTTHTKNSEVVATLKNPKLKTSKLESSKNEIQKSKVKTGKKKIKSPKFNYKKHKEQIVYKKIPKDIKVGKNIYFDGKEYMIQVSSWKNRKIAERQTKKLLKKGYNAFIVKVYLSLLGGEWYRVRIGGFKTKGEALKFLKRK